MPDQFKKFLQDHRAELDDKNSPEGLFDDIFQKVQAEPSVKSFSKANPSSFPLKTFLQIAAVGLMLFGVSTLFKKEINTSLLQNPSSNTASIQSQVDNDSEMQMKPNLVANETLSRNENIQSKIIYNKRKIQSTKSNITSEPITEQALLTENTSASELVQMIEPNPSNVSVIPTEIETAELSDSNPNVISKENITPIVSSDEIIHPTVSSDSNNLLTNKNSTEDQKLENKLKKGFFSFLSRKSRKWTNNTLAIDPVEQNQKTSVAINFRTPILEFNKSIKIYSGQ